MWYPFYWNPNCTLELNIPITFLKWTHCVIQSLSERTKVIYLRSLSIHANLLTSNSLIHTQNSHGNSIEKYVTIDPGKIAETDWSINAAAIELSWCSAKEQKPLSIKQLIVNFCCNKIII